MAQLIHKTIFITVLIVFSLQAIKCQDCDTKVSTEIQKCLTDSMDGVASSDQHKRCCAQWKVFDCYMNGVNKKCTSDEAKVMIHTFTKVIAPECKGRPKCNGSNSNKALQAIKCQDCDTKVSTDIQKCTTDSKDDLESSDQHKKYCAQWKVLDCRKDVVNKKCTSDEAKVMIDTFTKMIAPECKDRPKCNGSD